MSTGANTAQLQRLADEVLTGHNLAALDGIFHADYVEDEPPPGMGPGRDGLRQWLAGGLRRSPTCDGQSRNRSQTKTEFGAAPSGKVPTKVRFSAFLPQGRTSPWPRGPLTGSQTAR